MFNKYGLNNEEVIESRKKYGTNSITGKNKNTFINLFIETLGDPIIKILLIALAIKTIFLFKDLDYFETIGIVIAVLIAALISAVSEYGSNKAFERMQEESSKINVRVRRNNNITEIPINDIVVGDIIILSSGDKVPADAILIKGKLSVDESTLNGETKEVDKIHTNDLNVIEEFNKIYRGTVIYEGEAEALVKNIGMNTMYGKMARVLIDQDDSSPLKQRLNKLAKNISKVGYVAALLISISYLISKIFMSNNFNIDIIKETLTLNTFLGYLLEAMTLAVSVLVMSVPEGLPMMITLVLSTNSKKMLKDNVLVRKMVGIDTAGSLNILFTDKTGTITKGKMEVVSVIDGDRKEYISQTEIPSNFLTILEDSIIYNCEAEYDETTGKTIGGNITDKALLNFAKKIKDKNINIIDKIPFNSKNKYSVSIIKKDNKKIKLMKGAPDKIIKYCDSYINSNGKKKDLDKDKLMNLIEEKTKVGLRAIAIAYSESIHPTDNLRRSTLLSIILIKDDIRKEAKDGISIIKNGGINITMVTGDSKETATSIAKEVGIITDSNDIIITSNELEKMSDNELKKILPHLRVVARALPADKERLVNLSKELNLVTGMTGDGVNDVIALKKSDVAFAMGSGTEVAKEASDIVILDDNILSISKAILYGRTIYKNIRKFIIFQLTVNVSAVFLTLLGPFIGIPNPITVIQMLWINMVMDTLAGLAFSYEVPRLEYMKEVPKKKEENIINKYMAGEILLGAVYTLIISLIFLKSPLIKNIFIDNNHHITAFFSLFIFVSVFNAFNARTHRLNIFAHLKDNKVFILIITFIIIVQILIIYSGITIFNTVPIKIKELLLVIVISIFIIPVDIIRKIILKKIKGNFDI